MSDIYIIIHISTTCDDSPTFVTKDSSELIEFAWETVDSVTLETLYKGSNLVRPTNTPITPYCSKIHRITWDNVKNAGSFKDAITNFDQYVQEHIISKKKEFSIVMFDISKLRVQLVREARDKSVVLPSYLQHPRIFDLPREYLNWQSSHPETLSYPPTSLTNIITALEVEVENISEYVDLPNFSSTPSPSKASATTTTTTANVTAIDVLSSETEPNGKVIANLHAKIAKQLIKKSIPVENHPNVFTRPFDSAQDITAFTSERSKVLYLSNLPNDTTQSELESWFTQYGGRPGGFWTFKSADDNNNNNNNNSNGGKGYQNARKYGISGFVAFNTHEEAVDCLALNGRVLNDRPIEVQASSSKVFDMAMDKLLLTSFPLSKNRPRPGDWTCLSCGFSNFQRRTHCFRCSFAAVAFQDVFNSNTGNANGNGNVSGNHNHNHNSGARRGMNLQPAQANEKIGTGNISIPSYNDPIKGPTGNVTNHLNNSETNLSNNTNLNNNNHHSNNYHNNYHHHNNNNNNHGNSNGNTIHGRSHYNNSVPFRAGDWKCENCMYHNFAKNLCCLKCGVAKPAINNQQNNTIHSVNSTAAAIAAATASGQPLNLNNNAFLNLQQQQSQSQPQGQHHYNQHSRNNNASGASKFNNGYNPKNQYYNNNSKNLSNNFGLNGMHQQNQNQILMYSQQLQQQQQQQQHDLNGSSSSHQSKLQLNNTEGLYRTSGQPNLGYPSINHEVSGPATLRDVSNNSPALNSSSLNSLANHMNSLNLNQ
ncbi:conserved hypothetical protein [Candida albicans WO-1]|uniref:Nrp1p n=2 Tax=Candida albicans TaxID=5476 RepID=Q5A791_CANAL|nr:Nrp1p [Candida albicans SC5314]EEQ42411.1 conserved hypothetical protein [Candida albicans WO-1]KGQ90461.1 hypothetical protein MEO_00775 [Candida albicans P94015]KHC40811.1 hypothetical protein MGO_00763 [Candida albicans P76055]KHC60107.1 hypothetical protein MGC_00771 [Candida albicans P37039]AOW26440.1 Nrp1p [Candida albicans SC5314]|eukprot:XP_717609.1 Nrp1p [Candida albicans SC5314]